MLNRESDVPYCGVDVGKIRKACPILHHDKLILLTEWISERYKIHLRKDVEKLPAPWTDNVILQSVKFTNTRREHDRATIWAIDNICLSDMDIELKIINLILFRLYNKWETCEMIGMPIDFFHHGDGMEAYEFIRDKFKERAEEDPSYVFFTSAFNTGGMKAASGRLTGEQYIPMRPIAFMHHMIMDGIVDKIMEAKDQRTVCDILMNYPGIGEFLSYQMFVDFTYCPEYKFSENEFTIAGPGCQLGLSMLFKDYDGLSPEELLFWLRDNQDEIFGDKFAYDLMTDLPDHDRTLNVMSLENIFCEFSKYVRCNDQVKEGKKPRARVSYDGTGTKQVINKIKTKSSSSDPNRTIEYMGKRITQEEQDLLNDASKRVNKRIKMTDLYEASLFEDKPVYSYGFDYKVESDRSSRTLFQILGTNGSGKSTIPKGLVQRDTEAYLLETEFAWLAGNMGKGFELSTKRCAFATVLPNLGLILIGDYTPGTNIAGCDTLVRATMEQSLDYILNDDSYKDFQIMMEGVVLSSSRWHIDRFKAAGMVPHMLFMDTPLDVCMERLVKRNAERGKTPNVKNVESKWEETRLKAERCEQGTHGYDGVKAIWVDHSMSIHDTVEWFINNYLK